MDLVRGVLVWLPLGRLLEVYSGALSPELTRLRIETINQVDEAEIQKLARDLGFPYKDRAIWLATLQGELSQAAPTYVLRWILTYRALRLDERDWYDIYRQMTVRGSQDVFSAQAAYQSGDPNLVASFLDQTNVGPINLLDPLSVPWNRPVAEMTAHHLLDYDTRIREAAIRGFLGLLPAKFAGSKLKPETTLRYFVAGREQQFPGYRPKFTPPEIEFLRKHITRHGESVNEFLARSGCLGFPDPFDTHLERINMLVQAQFGIQPEVFRFLAETHDLSTLADIEPWTVNVHDDNDVITPDLARRCRDMLAVLANKPLAPSLPKYRATLQVIAGLPVDEAITQSNPGLRRLLDFVAHPQLREVRLQSWGPVLARSMVHYDIDNWLRVRPTGQTMNPNDFFILYGEGKLLQALRYPAIRRQAKAALNIQPLREEEV